MTANAAWNPFHDLNAGQLDLNRFFGVRSYHRTGGESYYGLLYTCKGYKEFFLHFFYSIQTRWTLALACKINGLYES